MNNEFLLKSILFTNWFKMAKTLPNSYIFHLKLNLVFGPYPQILFNSKCKKFDFNTIIRRNEKVHNLITHKNDQVM